MTIAVRLVVLLAVPAAACSQSAAGTGDAVATPAAPSAPAPPNPETSTSSSGVEDVTASPAPSATGATSRVSSTTVTRSTTPVPGGPVPTVVVGDTADGTVVTLSVGQQLRVVLSSTYWTFAASSSPAVLAADGQPVVSPQPSGCVPGAGCGTATATFRAVSPGSATVTATRISCGEALRCTGSAGRYVVQVVVR